MTLPLGPLLGGGGVLAAQELLLAVTQTIGSVLVASLGRRGGSVSCSRYRRQVGGGPLVTSVTLGDHRHVLLKVPEPGVHLPALPVIIGTVNIVVLLVLDASVEGVDAVSDEPVFPEDGGDGVGREIFPVHILVPDQGVAHRGSSQTKTPERLFLAL